MTYVECFELVAASNNPRARRLAECFVAANDYTGLEACGRLNQVVDGYNPLGYLDGAAFPTFGPCTAWDALARGDVALFDAFRDAAFQFLEGCKCECGEITGVCCEWRGPRADTVKIEWMPEYLRASHEAAGNRGRYPANGAVRLRVSVECAQLLVDDEPEWTVMV